MIAPCRTRDYARKMRRSLHSRSVRWIAFAAVLVFSFVAARTGSGAGHAIILQYHHFGSDTPASTSVTMDQFERHLAYLVEHDFKVWPLQRIIEYLQKGKPLPEKCIALTIDDAYRSVYDRAFPLLKERGWPFTVFVPAEGVDRGFESYMTWEEMRTMLPFGATFANHSYTHGHLVRRKPGESDADWRKRVERDIRRCQSLLEKELGSAPLFFAYPYGEYDTELERIVRSLGFVGFGQQSGGVWSGSDFGAVPRFPMAAHYADMDQFIPKVNSLPLPVVSAEPRNPVLPEGVPIPVLRLRLAPGGYIPEGLACFASGQGRIAVRWIDRENLLFEITAGQPLPLGRSRYNCTAPDSTGRHYYWYSHPWIRSR